ncbi:MAG TPA: hypothetical protein VG838_11310 [Opitutaceae bacterium]|nr:hypothetical protein [Opitutaceae bacterium]
MPLPPAAARLLRIALVVLGALVLMDAVVNLFAAIELIEPSDEESIGLTRNFVLGEYSVQLLVGAAMLFFGLRRRRSAAGPRRRGP